MSDAIKWAAITASLLGVLGAPASAATDKVTVIRGNAVEATVGQRGAKLPTVFRGQAADARRAVPEPKPQREPAAWIATAGDNLWFVDRDSGRIIGCWLQESTQVGEIDIRCGESPGF